MVDEGAQVEVVGGGSHPALPPRWLVVHYDLLARHARAAPASPCAGVVVGEAYFIKTPASAHIAGPEDY